MCVCEEDTLGYRVEVAYHVAHVKISLHEIYIFLVKDQGRLKGRKEI